jgi:hypothetical protein
MEHRIEDEKFDQLEPTVETLQGRRDDFLEEPEVPTTHLPAEYADVSPVLAKHIEQLEAAVRSQDEVYDNLRTIIEDQREVIKSRQIIIVDLMMELKRTRTLCRLSMAAVIVLLIIGLFI